MLWEREMRTYKFDDILNWLIGIHLNSEDPVAKDMSGEAVDLIKDQRKWLNRSHDMNAAYRAGYDRGVEDARKGFGEA